MGFYSEYGLNFKDSLNLKGDLNPKDDFNSKEDLISSIKLKGRSYEIYRLHLRITRPRNSRHF